MASVSAREFPPSRPNLQVTAKIRLGTVLLETKVPVVPYSSIDPARQGKTQSITPLAPVRWLGAFIFSCLRAFDPHGAATVSVLCTRSACAGRWACAPGAPR